MANSCILHPKLSPECRKQRPPEPHFGFKILPFLRSQGWQVCVCVVVSFTTLRHTNRPWNVTPTPPQNPVANRCNAWFGPEWDLKTVTEVQEVCLLRKRDRIKSSRYMSCMKMYVSLYLLGLHLSNNASPSDSSACPRIIISCIYTGCFPPPWLRVRWKLQTDVF